MQCVVLAGGLGTRLRPLTESLPKAMIEVTGRPFADIQLAQLRAWGFDEVVFSIGFGGDQIRRFVGKGSRWGLKVSYSDEGDHLRGTGGALRVADELGLLDSTFALIYGDSYLEFDAGAVWTSFTGASMAAVMTVYRNEGRYDTSNARVEGPLVVRYEKGLPDPGAAGMHHIDYGFSIIDRDAVLPLIQAEAVVDLADIYTRLSAAHRLAAYEVTERFFEIGSHSGLAELEALLATEGSGS